MSDHPDLADLPAVAAFVETVAREAGDKVSSFDALVPRPDALRLKGRRDPVTAADVASERHIVARLRAAWPGVTIHAEEEAQDERRAGLAWYIDPLDGTVNFSQAHPFFSVSIALYEDDEPLVGVVHAPRLDETFVAHRGGGCWLNGERVNVSGKSQLIDAVLATGFGYRREQMLDDNVGHFTDLVLKVRGMRRGGSAALDLAYVAAGRLDGFWELHLQPFDMAAGALLVREAGGVVTDMAGGASWLHGRTVIATNAALHPLLVDVLDTPDVVAAIRPREE